ncbi:MAG: DUF3256 family protein [Paludibacteraceae bacterium]|nr:DUF3256 family protein [Paludibacteraceae bacterium]
MKKALLFIALLVANLVIADPVEPLMEFLRDLHGAPEILEQTEEYLYVRMAEECYYHVYSPAEADSIVLIQTVCAPICSSCVRVYNKEWELLRQVWPTRRGIFQEATFRDGQIYWIDHTSEYLDEEEKQRQ